MTKITRRSKLPRLTITCAHCGKVFEVKGSQHWRKTCSFSCMGAYKKSQTPKPVPKPCPECGAPRMTAPDKDPSRCPPCARLRCSLTHKTRGFSPQKTATTESEKKRKDRLADPEVIAARAAKLAGRKCASPKTAEGSRDHGRAVHAVFRSPDNKIYHAQNITAFVRENMELFAPEDVVNKVRARRSGRPSSFSCNASHGLMTVHRGFRGTWKGWTVVSFTETFYNKGENLLSGEQRNG